MDAALREFDGASRGRRRFAASATPCDGSDASTPFGRCMKERRDGGGRAEGTNRVRFLTLFLQRSFSIFGSGARKVVAAVVTGRAAESVGGRRTLDVLRDGKRTKNVVCGMHPCTEIELVIRDGFLP